MSKQSNLHRLLSPQNIVFIGGHNLKLPISNTQELGFNGSLWVVNPNYKDISGIRCYPSISELPGIPDAAFIAVNAELTIQIVKELNQQGCGGAVCYASGFTDIGNTGNEREKQLVEAAGDMALVGPNCYGLLNLTKGACLWPDRIYNAKVNKGVALISQSTNIALSASMQDRSLPISHIISEGNQVSIDTSDYINALLEDPAVMAIGLYMENLRDINAFSRSALHAWEKGVPLFVLKTGALDLDDIYQAMFDRLGIIRVDSLAELLETLKIASLCEPAQGNRISVLTCSNVDSVMMKDNLINLDLALPTPNESQQQKLSQILPNFIPLSNPLNYGMSIWGDLEACSTVFSTMMTDNYDVTVLVIDYPRQGKDYEWQIAIDSIINAHRRHQKTTVVICNLNELIPENTRRQLINAGIAPLQGLKDGVAALAHWIDYNEKWQQIGQMTKPETLLLQQSTNLVNKGQALNEWDSKQLLSCYGIPSLQGQLTQLNEAPRIADVIGYPVMVKGINDQLNSMTAINTLALNLNNRHEVAEAATKINTQLTELGLHDTGFLIESMALNVVAEITLSVKRKEPFGPVLTLQTAGVFVDIIHDSTTLLLPTDVTAVTKAINSLKGSKLLQGMPGKAQGDIAAVINVILAVSDFVVEHWDNVIELNINPLLVLPKGKGAVVANALVNLST